MEECEPQEMLKRERETYVSSIVGVFKVTTSGDSSVASDATVDGIDAPERVDVDLQVGERLVRAWLERLGVTSCGRVKCMDRSQDRVGVLSATDGTVSGVDVGNDKTVRS